MSSEKQITLSAETIDLVERIQELRGIENMGNAIAEAIMTHFVLCNWLFWDKANLMVERNR